MSETATIIADAHERHMVGSDAEHRVVDLPTSSLRGDQNAQPREHLNTDVTKEYTEAMADGATFPPLVVFHDGASYWLADGFHRHYAAHMAGIETLPCEIHKGTLRDAILYSCGANAAHGYRRSNEDKRRAVRRMLEDEEWQQWPQTKIALQCNVTQGLVSKMAAEMHPTASYNNNKTRTVQRGDSTYEMNTGAIGKTKGNGPRVTPPDGTTVAELCRQGMEFEAGGATPKDAAQKVGVSINSYRQMRDIVLLADREDLSSADTEMVAKALTDLNETGQPAAPHKAIRPIVERVWGTGERRGKGTRAQHEARRIERFEHAFGVLMHSCSCAPDLELPHLTEARAKEAIKEIAEARSHLRALQQRIQEMHK